MPRYLGAQRAQVPRRTDAFLSFSLHPPPPPAPRNLSPSPSDLELDNGLLDNGATEIRLLYHLQTLPPLIPSPPPFCPAPPPLPPPPAPPRNVQKRRGGVSVRGEGRLLRQTLKCQLTNSHVSFLLGVTCQFPGRCSSSKPSRATFASHYYHF